MNWVEFRRLLAQHFDIEELQTLCFDLNVDYDALRGEGKEAKCRELIALFRRNGRMPELVTALSRHRPHIPWSRLVPKDKPFVVGPKTAQSKNTFWYTLAIVVIFILVLYIGSLLLSPLFEQPLIPTPSATLEITAITSTPTLTIVTAPTSTPELTPTPSTESTIPPTKTDTPTNTATSTSTIAPTSTNRPTDTPTITLTSTPIPPDLVIIAISNATCVRDHREGAEFEEYVRHTITVRNIGSGTTAAFGPFSNRVTLDFSGQRYDLEEWASRFNGVVGEPDLIVENLGVNEDTELTLSIDLRGFTTYSIEVIANSGSETITESNTTNNIFSQSFTPNC